MGQFPDWFGKRLFLMNLSLLEEWNKFGAVLFCDLIESHLTMAELEKSRKDFEYFPRIVLAHLFDKAFLVLKISSL